MAAFARSAASLSPPHSMLANLTARGLSPAAAQAAVDALDAAAADKKAADAAVADVQRARKALAKAGGSTAPERLREEGAALKVRAAEAKARAADAAAALAAAKATLPNEMAPDTPIGGEEANVVVRSVGTPPESGLDHVDFATARKWIEFEAASAVSGPAFYYLAREAVQLEAALVAHALDTAIAAGFVPYTVPEIVHEHLVERCGFQPRGESSQVYKVTTDSPGHDAAKCLIGTAEIPLAGRFLDTLIPLPELPDSARSVAVSRCFRAEAGASGRATRGLYRVHQFTKVELFGLAQLADAKQLHAELLALSESIVASLDLPYRVLRMASRELGAPAYAKYDIEAWMPSRGGFGEVASVSNCTTYQAARLNTRIHDPRAPKKSRNSLAATLNGTAAAIPRLIMALIENHGTVDEDGRPVLALPPALRPYLGGRELL
ncbi:seryl-tRNA synthetase [Thecamonas trahens ATCC 50062]|uniref:serine--tRNA ligase n=1 Tax=Thecamonas trahens ATCC 50062 TaxID=461836 RepID=A0A0L0DB43_THETB|nr:seryl-tRNA synthetase [Thecamonas trahens ATCC 50062]KNC49552.1 seryl-tRNA synthetase [Thecamonas trahens ATCC 50062]|eukprot:XP_013757662.1 seryl-tRNA synthetase [Thecamonas trahens ATCC 50062]